MGRLRYIENSRTGNPGARLVEDKYFYIRDTGMYIRSSADGTLDIVSDTTLNLTAPTVKVGSGSGMWADYPIDNPADPSLYFGMFDDFTEFTEADTWTTTEDSNKSGTDGVMDEVGGVYANFCDGDDNDESYCISEGEVFKFTTGKKMWFEAKLRVDEANTDDANVMVGVSDSAEADMILDNGGGPAASYDGAVFFKVDGGTKWQFETSNAGDQVTNATLGTYADDTFARVGFYFDGATTITPYFNGTAGTAHTISCTGLEEMHLFFGIKAGDTNEESVEIDYIKCIQER